MDRLCSKCGGNGPFPPRGRICRACLNAAGRENRAKRKASDPEKLQEQERAKQQRFRASHPERFHEIARRSMRKRYEIGKVQVWLAGRRERVNEIARRSYQKIRKVRYQNDPEYRTRIRAYQKAYYQKRRKDG